MKKLTTGLLLAALALPAQAVFGAEEPSQSQTSASSITSGTHTGWAAGMDLNDLSGDFGIGLNATSPYVYSFALRLSAGESFVKGFQRGDLNESTLSYGTLKLGIVGSAWHLTNLLSLYGQGGAVVFVPSGAVSSKIAFGGYGSFGLEYTPGAGSPNALFLEIGDISGATANMLQGQPRYASGFAATVGDRFYF